MGEVCCDTESVDLINDIDGVPQKTAQYYFFLRNSTKTVSS